MPESDSTPPPGTEDRMPTPGAMTSGLSAYDPATGPREEKRATWSSRSVAPTVIASPEAAGEPIVM